MSKKIENYNPEKPEFDSFFLDDLVYYLEQKGLPNKEAVVKHTRYSYIKEKDLIPILEKESKYVVSELNKVLDYKIEENISVNNLFAKLKQLTVESKILLPAIASEIDKKLKYPKRLTLLNKEKGAHSAKGCCPSDDDSMDEKKDVSKERIFYVMNFERKPRSNPNLWLGAIVIGILGFCLFPLWPLELKLAIWWISYILLIVIVSNFLIFSSHFSLLELLFTYYSIQSDTTLGYSLIFKMKSLDLSTLSSHFILLTNEQTPYLRF